MGDFSYKNIKRFLEQNYPGVKFEGARRYDGDLLWEEFFMQNEFFAARIKQWKILSFDQLHYYANEKANGR